ncbi:MAG: bacillithiol biosynthesis cysteine-adding enzyme BshC [Acidobacteria bacterium]|nr:MAG: bacillithiol biosynthesis cysteine-adding enzyme BshC [Acidobacteriota bacterium]
MECTCVRQTELPHTSKLFADLVYHPDRVKSFYPFSPHDAESFAAAARQIQLTPERRAALVHALREQNGPSASLDLLAKPGAVAVVTGQQVGLFSGPAYTVYKALTAAKLARDLMARGIPAVPVFWLATEDHDFAEVNHVWVFDSGHQPVKLEINGSAGSSKPVGEVRLASLPLNGLRAALHDFPFGGEIADRVALAYIEGRTLGEAFSALLRDILRPFDILQIDPMARAVRELAAPTIRAAISGAPELKQRVLERNRELNAAGYHAQVHVEDETSFFFLLENGRRVTLRKHNGDYISANRHYSAAELTDLSHEISPNALLRPVVQDSILPTVAYIGGPAELAYLAQAEVLYQVLLGRMPVVLHRSGFTIIDERARKLMTRYGLSLGDFFHGEDVLRERISAALVPPQLSSILAETRTTVASALERLEAELSSFDPTLNAAAQKSQRKMAYQLSKVERKVAHHMLRRDEKAARDTSLLYGLIYPRKHLQERLYSIIPLIAKHGFRLIDQIYENVHLECPDHQLLVV